MLRLLKWLTVLKVSLIQAIHLPDNLNSGVKSPCHYESVLNPSYHDMVKYYDVAENPVDVIHFLETALAGHLLTILLLLSGFIAFFY